MRIAGWVWLFLVFGAVAVAEASLDRPLLPYAGTLTLLALLGFAATRYATAEPGRPRAARSTAAGLGLGGLALVTLAAAVVEGERRDWPAEFGGSGLAEVVLLSGGVALLAIAVLGQALPGLDRRLLWPAGLIALPVGGFLMLTLGSTDYLEPPWWEPAVTRAVLVLPFGALILVIVAANAAFAAGPRLRRAGAGLLAAVILALGAISAAFSLDLSDSRAEPTHNAIAIRVDPSELGPGGRLTQEERRAIEYYQSNQPEGAVAYAEYSSAADAAPARSTILPALAAVLVLAGLAALTTVLFPAEERGL